MKCFPAILFILVFVYSCNVSRMAYYQDMSSTYKFESTSVHPDFLVYHNAESTSDVYFSVSSKELLYSRQSNETDFTSRFSISYLLTASYESKVVVDSGRISVTDINNGNIPKFVRGKFSIKAGMGNNGLLKVIFYDLNRKQGFDKYIDVFKSSVGTPQNFFVSTESGTPLFKNTVSANEQVMITYKRAPKGKLYGRFFKSNYPAANPPFSVMEPKAFSYKPDSMFIVQLNDTGMVTFRAPQKGIYNFSIDSNRREGLTLYRYYDGFPDIVKAEQMVFPLRYITSKEEYEEITGSKNKKLAVETFWLNCAGNKDRGKDIIRTYYTRVRYANMYFSSYLEGWKTDRGMIYIIFGPPNLVYQATGSETWVYGEESNANSVSFNFNRLINPLSDNDYFLQRSNIYKSGWFREVDDIWRQGRVYLQN